MQVRLVFERPSREWEQQVEEAEALEMPSVSGARVGISCSAAAASTPGADTAAVVSAGQCMVARFSCSQQVRVLRDASPPGA